MHILQNCLFHGNSPAYVCVSAFFVQCGHVSAESDDNLLRAGADEHRTHVSGVYQPHAGDCEAKHTKHVSLLQISSP